MSDDALIRLENLLALNISATDLVKSVGSSYQYWRDLMAGKKSFGEKAARRIEEGMGLPRGSLDVPGINPLEKMPEAPSAPTDINVNRRAPPDAVALLTNLCEMLTGLDPDRSEMIADMLGRLAKKPNDLALVQVIALLMEPKAFAQQNQRTVEQTPPKFSSL